MAKNIGVVGLGLIGASLAKSLKTNTNNVILGYDIDKNVVNQALNDKTIDLNLEDKISDCDIAIICLYPNDTINYIEKNIKLFKKNCIIIDCAGIKSKICDKISKLCFNNNINFIGGHPMAGIEKSGYAFSNAHLFDGATMVFCKDNFTQTHALEHSSELFKSIGFDKITYSTPTEHDEIIAFTSQLAHVVSNAYVQSEQASKQMGFSGGSYKDLTRVAYLNENMWSELFIANKSALCKEIRALSTLLNQYADLIDNENEEKLKELLKNGKEMKLIVG